MRPYIARLLLNLSMISSVCCVVCVVLDNLWGAIGCWGLAVVYAFTSLFIATTREARQ